MWCSASGRVHAVGRAFPVRGRVRPPHLHRAGGAFVIGGLPRWPAHETSGRVVTRLPPFRKRSYDVPPGLRNMQPWRKHHEAG